MTKFSVRFFADSQEFVVIEQNLRGTLDRIVFRTQDEGLAAAWIQATQYEQDQAIYHEFG